jgi:uncharacterized protein YgbK (DUF1537 family)
MIGEAREVYEGTIPLATPFDALKTATQNVQFAIDPSKGLTKSRYGWFSNGSRFDSTFVGEIPGAIEIETGTSGTDQARVRSAFAGQYVSQALAQPGQGVVLPNGLVTYDDANQVQDE